MGAVSGISVFKRSQTYNNDKMHLLILKYIEQTITLEEKKELCQLVQSDETIRKEFAYAQNVYALSASISEPTDEQDGYRHLRKFKKLYKKERSLSFFKKSLQYAAVIIATIVSTWLFLDIWKEEDVLVTYEEFKTPPGQRALLKLHDGTEVWLNASSSLRYPNVFKGKERKVELDGEAFFSVKHNPENPFIVSTEKLDIKAMGTRFNVYAYKGRDEFNAYLEEGSIKIYHALDEGAALFLKPEEFVTLDAENRLLKRVLHDKSFLLWRDGIYSFDDLAFKEIIKKLELYYDITISIENEDLAAYRFSGKFRQRDGIVSALRTFQKAYRFSFSKDDELNHIIIR